MITCICGYEAPLAEYEAAGACEDCIICPECNIQIVYTGSHAWVHECTEACEPDTKEALYMRQCLRTEIEELAALAGYTLEWEVEDETTCRVT